MNSRNFNLSGGSFNAVPEPASWVVMMMAGFGGAGFKLRRRGPTQLANR